MNNTTGVPFCSLLVMALAIGCNSPEQPPSHQADPPATRQPSSAVGSNGPDISTGHSLKINDEELIKRFAAANEKELVQWIVDLRKTPLPADYTPPDWLAAAGTAFEARQAVAGHYAELTKRMSAEGRVNVVRSSPHEVRAMYLAEKYVAAMGGRESSGITKPAKQ